MTLGPTSKVASLEGRVSRFGTNVIAGSSLPRTVRRSGELTGRQAGLDSPQWGDPSDPIMWEQRR